MNLNLLKQFVVDNSVLEKNLKIKYISLHTVVFSLNQLIKVISFVKSQNQQIFVYSSDPYIIQFYRQVLKLLDKEAELKNIIFGTKKDLFFSIQKQHNIGLLFLLNCDKYEEAALSKHAFIKNIFLFSAALTNNFIKDSKFYDKFLFPLNVKNIKDNIFFILFLILI